jgi:hypothetical protein
MFKNMNNMSILALSAVFVVVILVFTLAIPVSSRSPKIVAVKRVQQPDSVNQFINHETNLVETRPKMMQSYPFGGPGCFSDAECPNGVCSRFGECILRG